jgi:hypothetical protein
VLTPTIEHQVNAHITKLCHIFSPYLGAEGNHDIDLAKSSDSLSRRELSRPNTAPGNLPRREPYKTNSTARDLYNPVAWERLAPVTDKVCRQDGQLVLLLESEHKLGPECPVIPTDCESINAAKSPGLGDQPRLDPTLLELSGAFDQRGTPPPWNEGVACVNDHYGTGGPLLIDQCVSPGQTAQRILRSTTGLNLTLKPRLMHDGESRGLVAMTRRDDR